MDDAGLSDKEKYLNHWGYILGTPEAEQAWKEKQEFDQGKRTIGVPMFFGVKDICYDSPIDGRPITSMAARREDLARSNCIEYDPEMRKDAVRRQQEADQSLDNVVEKSIEAEFEKMPSRQKEKLASELQSGVTAEPIRLGA